MTDQTYMALFAALTIAVCLVSRLEGASFGAVRPAEGPVPALQAQTQNLCAPVTTLVPIPCFRP